MAEGQGMFDGLNNLPVFEGVPDEERRRALMQAGLALMQPQNPITGGGPLAALSGGVSTGLASLDESEAKRLSAEQLAFQNSIATQAANADTIRAGAAVTQAEAAEQTADTGLLGTQNQATQFDQSLLQQASEFDAKSELRDAKVDLDTAQAEWLRRRHDGTPAGAAGGKPTQATIDAGFIEAHMNNLYRSDPAKYTLPSGEKNLSLLMDQSFVDLHRIESVAGSDQIGFIAEGADDAGRIGENISAMQGNAPQPQVPTTSVPGVPENAPIINSVREFEALPSGTVYIHNGRGFTKP